MRSEVLFEQGEHRWVVLGRDRERRSGIIDTNQYAIESDRRVLLLDPGGIDIFPEVLSAFTRHYGADQIEGLFASHQDPDIISSLPMWLDLCPGVKTHASWMWRTFLAHFAGGHEESIIPVPDEGTTLRLGPRGLALQLVPAHYCHSAGNFSLFDPAAKILFSGDIGAALLPENESPFFVESFEKHVEHMRGFHLRWMPSPPALRRWVERVRELQPAIICPQHGSIFRGDDVGKLLDWLERLEVGRIGW